MFLRLPAASEDHLHPSLATKAFGYVAPPAALVCKELPPLSSCQPCTSHLSATAGAPRSVTDVSPWRAAVSTAPRAQVGCSFSSWRTHAHSPQSSLLNCGSPQTTLCSDSVCPQGIPGTWQTAHLNPPLTSGPHLPFCFSPRSTTSTPVPEDPQLPGQCPSQPSSITLRPHSLDQPVPSAPQLLLDPHSVVTSFTHFTVPWGQMPNPGTHSLPCTSPVGVPPSVFTSLASYFSSPI